MALPPRECSYDWCVLLSSAVWCIFNHIFKIPCSSLSYLGHGVWWTKLATCLVNIFDFKSVIIWFMGLSPGSHFNELHGISFVLFNNSGVDPSLLMKLITIDYFCFVELFYRGFLLLPQHTIHICQVATDQLLIFLNLPKVNHILAYSLKAHPLKLIHGWIWL